MISYKTYDAETIFHLKWDERCPESGFVAAHELKEEIQWWDGLDEETQQAILELHKADDPGREMDEYDLSVISECEECLAIANAETEDDELQVAA